MAPEETSAERVPLSKGGGVLLRGERRVDPEIQRHDVPRRGGSFIHEGNRARRLPVAGKAVAACRARRPD